MQNLIVYNYEIGEKIFFFDQRTAGFSRGTVTQIDIDSYTELLIVTNKIYYHLQLNNGNTVRIIQDATFAGVTGGAPPSLPRTITIEYSPTDIIWTIDSNSSSVASATIVSSETNIFSGGIRTGYIVNYDHATCDATNNVYIKSVDVHKITFY